MSNNSDLNTLLTDYRRRETAETVSSRQRAICLLLSVNLHTQTNYQNYAVSK